MVNKKLVVFKPQSAAQNINSLVDTKKDFSWIIDNSQRILKSSFANAGGNSTIYEVPIGKVLYITNVNLTADNNSGASSDEILIRLAGDILSEMYVAKNNTEFAAFQFSLPLKLIAGDKIIVYAGGTAKAIGGFTGYLINSIEQPNIKFSK